MTIPHAKYGHSLKTCFRCLTCLLDRGHIIYETTNSHKIFIILNLGAGFLGIFFVILNRFAIA